VTADRLAEIPAGDWDARLDGLGLTDAYLRRGYLRSGAALAGAEPVLLHLAGADGDVVFAALLRDDPTDVSTPYGYGGPVAVGAGPPVAEFASAYEQWCARRGVVSSFVLYHPLFANQELALPAFRHEALTGTISWSLETDDLLVGLHRHHRRMIRRARAAEVEVQIDEAPAGLDAFRALYTATMTRAGADPFYLFGDEYWELLASEVALVAVDVWRGEEHLAAILGLTGAPWLHYHLGGSSEAGRSLGANHLAMLALAFLTTAALTEHAQPPPAGLIPLTRNEIARLAAALITQTARGTRHRLHWPAWRRRHQHTARTCHYQRQAARDP